MKDCCWACARHHFILLYRQASLGRTISLQQWRKGNCDTQTSQCCLEAELGRCAKMWAELPAHLDTALSKMLWTLLSNSHTSETGTTPPSESGRRKIVTRATPRQEMCYSMLRVAWTAAPMPVWNSDRLWLAFLMAGVKVMLSAGVEDKNPKAAGWLKK